ncbi:MAG: ATP synthase F1 subunit epsilon [Trichodesmium sp. St16_bin2-tuft]|jgi:F-type H+-transporting ATPase subunit epsilon|nr:F0F1 ATP synthase subunit epsilon [Trichodesmium sp. MAG_R02]MDE5086684.1 ATP synthase F1 subunit epsilon [Trichodesmium sp. St16_bin2-tuft]MDE5108703.1 ATP synthase F1 subunit epsilon [Trichodesmium sp. St17_bin3_1_1]
MTLNVRVIAPDEKIWDSEAQEIILPSTTGQLGILGGHAPLLTALDIGVMRVRHRNDWIPIALMGGFAEIEADEVNILVNGAERGDKIDKQAARLAHEEAEKRLQTAEGGDNLQEKIQAKVAFKRTRARLQAAGGMVN